MRNHLKISLWSLALAATTTGAVLAMHMQATPPGSTGSLIAANASAGIESARPSAIAADAGSIKSFGFLVFDWDPNAGVPGFDAPLLGDSSN